MGLQTELDFIPILTNQRMNNAESRSHHTANIEHFSDQCKLVYSLLCRGVPLTTTEALKYGIGDLRARIRDIIKSKKVVVYKAWVFDDEGKNTRFKQYSLKPIQPHEKKNKKVDQKN